MTTQVADATPREASLLRAFVNTVDHESGSDQLTDPAALVSWLREHELLRPGDEADHDDLQLALALRKGLRQALAAHHDGEPETGVPELETAAAALPLRLSFAGSRPHLEPVTTGAQGALARLLIAVDDCRLDGTWSRLKICPADDCLWAFYDTSKNRTRVWCAMGVCGNRSKTRAYRERQRRQPQS